MILQRAKLWCLFNRLFYAIIIKLYTRGLATTAQSPSIVANFP